MDRFLEMQTFAAVVDAGSFVKAAGLLGVSKAAASRHVGELEARLGVRLLHRTTRRLSLTAEGERFHLRCRELLAGVDEAESELQSGSSPGEAVGTLKVNVPVSFGLLHLASLWPAFMARHPRLRLEVTLSDRVVDLVDEGYDLAVRIARLPASSLVSRQIATTRLIVCASRRYLRAHGRPSQPSELARHRVLAYTLLSTGETWAFDGPGGPVSVRVQPALRSNSGDTCRAAALQHQGIVLQPSFLVGEDIAAGRLVELLPEWRAAEFGVHAVYPSRKHLAPRVRLLVEHLARAFRKPPWPA